MPQLNIARSRDLLQRFDFKSLFIDELGWSQPAVKRAETIEQDGAGYELRHIAELAGTVVVEVTAVGGPIPDAKGRLALHKTVAAKYHENLLVFTDAQRTQSLWYWVKREGGKTFPREHLYVKGQPGDLFISKFSAIFFDISRFDVDGNVSIVEVARAVRDALDVERVTKKFYAEYATQRLEFTELIEGIENDRDRRWYASVLLNRLMFIYFLQNKFLVDGGRTDYLQAKLGECITLHGSGHYYEKFLKLLFFEGFAKPDAVWSEEAKSFLGKVPYLNGGLFLEHPIELNNRDIRIPDRAFENLYRLFGRYSWNLNDTPGDRDDEINPDVLGYIFEKYINQKEFGAYYTRPEITEYLCEQTIHRLILDRINPSVAIPGLPAPRHFDSVADLLMNLDAPLCHRLLEDVLPSLSLLDPACGSGAFLVAAMRTLIIVYGAVTGRIEYLGDRSLSDRLAQMRAGHRSLNYHIKRSIITNNLFGVDIMEEGCEIAKLRLFLALVSSVQTPDQLEPLPNIDFNILPGNSLMGLLHVDDKTFNEHNAQGNLFRKTYRELLDEKNRLISIYRKTATYHKDLQAMRDEISEKKEEAQETLDDILLDDFKRLGIKFEQAAWDEARGGKMTKRALALSDIQALKPFHWGYEFDEVLNQRGGFDAIITNPPWEIFKPQAKEFFMEHSELVTKNKMTIKEFEEKQAELLRDPDIRAAWLAYLNRFPYVSAYYRAAAQYENQISVVNGKKTGTDINLYKLFTEQCFNLLRPGGQCGIVVPSGIYTDLGTKQLREMLFKSTQVTGLFCFENRKAVFEGVDSRFKFVVLTYGKGGSTEQFPTAFMRHDVTELETFPKRGSLTLSVDLIRRLSPDSLSIMEFKGDIDVRIAERMARFPLLGERIPGSWNIDLAAEFHMTNDSKLFKPRDIGRLPLYEGKMIWQFDAAYANPRFWVDEASGRKALLGRRVDSGQAMDYQTYRLGFRDIASNTNERTMVCTIIPPTFHGNKIPTVKIFDTEGVRVLDNKTQLYLAAVWNSFVIDSMLRQKVTTTLNFFYIYQLPIPRLTDADQTFKPLVERAAKLICTTPEFDDLAREVGLRSHLNGVTDPVERAQLRAELDGLVAQLYGLTDAEFEHILSTFPLVPKATREAALAEFRKLSAQNQTAPPGPAAAEALALIQAGESDSVEFKETLEYVSQADLTARNIPPEQKAQIVKNVVHSSLKTICAFLNSEGGTLLIGVHDEQRAVGIERDLGTVKNNNTDGFELKLRSLLSSRFTPKPLSQVKVAFPVIEGKTVCRVDVKPDEDIYHLDGSVYVRHGNSSIQLTGVDLTHWVSKRSGR
jgi:hypothetical protein